MNIIERIDRDYAKVKRSNAQHKYLKNKALKQGNKTKAYYHEIVSTEQWGSHKILSKSEKRSIFNKAKRKRKF
jgi:hypothetical protein